MHQRVLIGKLFLKKNKSIQFTPCTLQRKNFGDEGTKIA